jgi:hypothetical protein
LNPCWLQKGWNQAMRKLKRLLAMSHREMAHRIRERCYAESERFGLATGIPSAPPSFKTYLAGAPSERFYICSRAGLRQLFREEFPDWIERATSEASTLCRHEMRIFNGEPVNLGAAIDWHRDPITGHTWERRFWADYRPEHDPGGRDSKRVHELNRHQHLPRLAKAWWLTGEERFAAEAVSQLNGWIDRNPPHLGINWQSSLEISIRTISWMWTIFLLRESQTFDRESAQRIGDSLFAQLEHVYRHTSQYSSPNTHLIGEASALFIAGLVFRDDRRAARWLEYGAAALGREAETQILKDGVYGELSSWYHCYALDFYLQVLVLADQNNFPFPGLVRERIRSMLRFLTHLTRPDGRIPLLGDDDGGRALALANTTYRSFNDGLCVGAILFHCGESKYQAGGFVEESLWLQGCTRYEAYRRLESAPPIETQATFPDSGYTIQRTGWGPHDSQLIFDSGGLGIGTGGHAHADALSLSLFGGGRELLVDPGTFVYNGAPEWREYFRSTRAHNTVSIDGSNQAESGGTFRWNSRFFGMPGLQEERDGVQYIEGEHGGYLDVIHRRRLLHVVGEYWLVVDDFRGAGQHTFGFSFQLGPDVEPSDIEDRTNGFLVRERGGFLLGLHGSGEVATECLTGSTAPIGGSASAGYGAKRPVTSIHATMRTTAPASAMTYLVPSQIDATIQALSPGGNVLACRFKNDAFEDLAVYGADDSPIRIDGFEMRGEFFWLRSEGGSLHQVVAIRARSLFDRGGSVFQRSDAGSFFAALNEGGATTDKNLCAQSAAL